MNHTLLKNNDKEPASHETLEIKKNLFLLEMFPLVKYVSCAAGETNEEIREKIGCDYRVLSRKSYNDGESSSLFYISEIDYDFIMRLARLDSLNHIDLMVLGTQTTISSEITEIFKVFNVETATESVLKMTENCLGKYSKIVYFFEYDEIKVQYPSMINIASDGKIMKGTAFSEIHRVGIRGIHERTVDYYEHILAKLAE